MASTIIVVPSYNEADRFDTDKFSTFAASHPEVAFILVDDGSTDNTRTVLERLHETDPIAFHILALEENRGKAEAVRQGMLAALEAYPEYVGFWDADLATPLKVVSVFAEILDEIDEIELVTGARVQLLGRKIERRPKRHYAGRVFATIVSSMLRLAIYDTQCGAKLFRVTPRLAAVFNQPFMTNWIFDVEIIARMIRQRQLNNLPRIEDVIYEHPLTTWLDVPGSKVDYRAYLNSLVDLVRIHRNYIASPVESNTNILDDVQIAEKV